MEFTKRQAEKPRIWDIQLNPGGRPETMKIEKAAKVLGISRGLAYELARRSEFPGCRKLGRRYLASRRELYRWLDGESA